MSTPRRINILAMAFSNLRGVFSYDSSAGSSVAGNLSDNAPWSLPADVFASSASSPDFSASFNITGYNISANAPSPQSVPGWKLTAAVKNDVSLSTSTNSSVDKSSVFEATTLFIQAPADMTMDTSWRMCAVVYPGVNGVNSNSTTVDGSCNGVLDSGCLQALNIAGTSGPNGMDGAGNCGSFVLPAGCEGSISGTNMTAFGAFLYLFYSSRFLLLRQGNDQYSLALLTHYSHQTSIKLFSTTGAFMHMGVDQSTRTTSLHTMRRNKMFGLLS